MPPERSNRRQSKSHERRPRTSRAPLSTPQEQPFRRSPAATPVEEQLWSALRQGARNVAGVRYQLAVTAILLAESRSRVLPFVELVPEGYEDIDCLDSESTRWLVQVKEFGAGAGTFTASSMAEVISHAASARLTPARIVAITDGRLGAHLAETGWNRAVSETPGYDTQSTVAALTQRGYSNADANAILMRTHLVKYPWNIVPLLTNSIAHTYDVKPAVAALIAGRLVDTLGQIAADQRSTTASSVGRFRRADLDAIVQNTLAVVDVDALDSAVRLGVCDIADYTGQPATGQSRFLQGIDAIPAHIGSGFDVLRPTPCRAVQRAIETARYGLIAGPSGAGKSTQVWRSARDMATAVRVIRVHRVETDSDVAELVRHVQLLEPNDTHSVVVCCDDLGRPRTRAWSRAARRLLELPGVVLLGAVRQEDFTAELLRHGGVLVELRLDDEEATAIGNQLARTGVDLRLEISEAVRLADGQLMEFISLLTTGQRLRSVLADQAESLVRAGDHTTVRVARLICASHVLGVALDASYLDDAVNCGDPGALTQALLRLQDEHIITTEDQSAWRGLHQRRSEVLTELLHRTPPPTRTETLADVLGILHPSAMGWGLRRVAELFSDQVGPQAEVVPLAVPKCTDASALAALFEGLERADHSWTARSYIPVIDRHRRKGVQLLTWAFLVCANKLADVDFGADGDGLLGQLGRRVRECAGELPSRSTIYCEAAATALGNGQLLDHLVRAPLGGAVRLLEAVAPYVRLSRADLSRVSAAFEWPPGIQSPRSRLLYGRFLDACHRAASDSKAFGAVFGRPQERLTRACHAHPNAISALVSDDGGGATIELLADPREERDVSRLPWDSETTQDRDDPVNRRAGELATYVGECCPELEVVEVRTVIADGSPLSIRAGDSPWEPGHKRLDRNARPRRSDVRVNVGIRAAIARQVAAFSWTELVRSRERIAETVTGLVGAAIRRLSAHDNKRRRAEWNTRVQEVVDELAELPAPPVDKNWEPDRSAATWDIVPSGDGLTDAISNVLTALQALVARPPESLEYTRLSAQVGTALKKLRGAQADSETLTTGREADVYERLTAGVSRLRSLLVAISHDIAVIGRIKGPPSQLVAAIDQVISQSASTRVRVERRALEAVFSNIEGVSFHDVPDEDLFPSSVLGHRWIVGVAPEAWGEAVTAATSLDRNRVGVAVTLVCVTGDVMLPIALGVSWTNDGFMSVPPEEVSRIAGKLNRRTVPSGRRRFFSDVMDDLVLSSWKVARMRLRPQQWAFNEDSTPQEHLARARQRMHEERESTELVGILGRLADRVEEEILGGDLRPVAAAVAVPRLLDVQDTDGDEVMDLVERGTLLAVDEELRSCGAVTAAQDGAGASAATAGT